MTRPKGTLIRNPTLTRINHWITAACFVLLMLSGLSMFDPLLFWLSNLFGGGQWTRTIHPWLGVVLFFGFAGLFLRFWKANLWKSEDGTWMARLRDVLAGHEENLPEVGKYNAGQKVVFWAMSLLIIVLITSGLVIWDQYFAQYSTIDQKRVAVGDQFREFIGGDDAGGHVRPRRRRCASRPSDARRRDRDRG